MYILKQKFKLFELFKKHLTKNKKYNIMSLIKKGISALLITGLIMSCDEDGYEPIEPVDSSGGSIGSVFNYILTHNHKYTYTYINI